MKAVAWVFVTIAVIALIFILGPILRAVRNNYEYKLQKVDEVTDYQTLKSVEDACRAMIASYEADKLIFEQYKDSENSEKQSWGEQAKMRANRTAATYNEYIRKNSYIWKDAIPDDIDEKLEYIE